MTVSRKKDRKLHTGAGSDVAGRMLRGQYDRRTEPTLPSLCHLSRRLLGQLVTNEIVGGFEDAERQLLVDQFRAQGGDCPPNPNELMRFLMVRESEHLNLALFVERLAALKYDAHVLLSRRTASLAYRFLVAAIGALGPVPKLNRRTKRDENGHAEHFELLRRAVRAFVSLFHPDCYTAFFLNRRLNQVCSLFEDASTPDGLRVPEAITDCAWRLDDLPVQLLFDEGDDLIYPPFPTPAGGNPRVPQTKHAFERREGVDPQRVLALRLTWGSTACRAIIILNWRTGPGPDRPVNTGTEDNENPERWVRRIWADADAPTGHAAAEAPARIREALSPLHMAVRYFVGWLSAAQIDISQPFGEQLKSAPHTLIRDAAEAARQADPVPGVEAAALIGLLKGALDPNHKLSYQSHVHWIREPNSECPRRALVFQKGDYEGFTQKPSPAFDLELGADGLVHRSVCAQAAAWGVSLLIPNLDRHVTADKTWRDLHVARLVPRQGRLQPFACESELAVPIFESDGSAQRVVGVVNIEAKGKLKPEHLRHTELVVHLYQRLRAAYRGPEVPPTYRFLLDSITENDDTSRSVQRLSREFCGWLLDVLGADVAYLNVFDPRVRGFRPVGVAISKDNAEMFLNDDELLAHLGVAPLGAEPRSRDPEYTGVGSLLHGLIEHAAANRLLPRPDGLTEHIFRSKNGRLFAAKEHPRFGETTQKYAAWILALPFAQDQAAISDGVLWIYWRDGRQEPAGYPPFESRETFCAAVEERLKPVIEAVAAMYAIHRYHDPDRMGELLPSASTHERRRDH